MENTTLKYLYFDTKDSMYKSSFKIHKYKNASNLSIKAKESQIGYTKKLFPGDDRDQIIVNEIKVLYFEVRDTILLDTLSNIRDKKRKILFSYIEEDGKMILINFSCVDNLADIVSGIEIEVFPKECFLPNCFEGEWLEAQLEYFEVLKTIRQYH